MDRWLAEVLKFDRGGGLCLHEKRKAYQSELGCVGWNNFFGNYEAWWK
jgi:hypothetical protein